MAGSPRNPAPRGSTHNHPCATTPIPSVAADRRGGRSPLHAGDASGQFFAQTSPAPVRSDTPLLMSARGSGSAPESPDFGSRGLGADDDRRPTARTPLQPIDRRMGCGEHCASSPAFFLEALSGHTGPPASGSASQGGLTVAGTQIPNKKLGSARSGVNYNSARSTAASSEASAPNSGADSPSTTALPELWVTRWVDYSSKYGVGYILSDGSIGVYFNDSTKIILGPSGQRFDYVTRRTQEKPETRTTHSFEDYPEDLRKKVTLLRHFKNYMLTDCLEKKDGATMGESGLPRPWRDSPPQTRDGGQPPQLYVKKWMRNKHAILFQLCNKIVQVVFFDKTELVLSSKAHMVTYIDKRGQKSTYPLSGALDVPCPELAKRLRYTKDILINLLCGRAAKPGAEKEP